MGESNQEQIETEEIGASKIETQETTFGILNTAKGKILVDMIYTGTQTGFAYYYPETKKFGTVRTLNLKDNAKIIVAPQEDDVLRKRIMTLSDGIEDSGDEQKLFEEIRSVVHKYVDMREEYEMVVSIYIMLSWAYDEFFELPYLRILGDLSSGKSRLGYVISSLSYRGMRTIGAASISPIFRILDRFHCTMLIDESDMDTKQRSEKTEAFIQILNTGYSQMNPYVLRSEEGGKKGKRFEPKAFNVFSPKIICGRERMADEAFESRCFPIIMTMRRRSDVPLNITPSVFDAETAELRRKLMHWRLSGFGTRVSRMTEYDNPQFTSRLNQLVQIFSCLTTDERLLDQFKTYAQLLSEQMVANREDELEREIVSALVEVKSKDVYVQKILELVNAPRDEDDKIKARRLSWYLRTKMNIIPKRETHKTPIYVDKKQNWRLIREWAFRYGITVPMEFPELDPMLMEIPNLMDDRKPYKPTQMEQPF